MGYFVSGSRKTGCMMCMCDIMCFCMPKMEKQAHLLQ